MTNPMTTERLEEIRAADDATPQDLVTAGYGVVHEHRRALLAELDRLRDALAETETARNRLAEALGELSRCVLPCAICHGRGIYWTSCSFCGDSTFEHECDSVQKTCPAPACGDLRRALAALPVELLRPPKIM